MTDTRLHLATPAHVYANPAGALTAELAAEIGAAYDYITLGPAGLDGFEVAAAAAGARLGLYTKTDALASASALPEAGYAHKIGGARKYDTTWRVYTAQPDDIHWRTYHLNHLLTAPAWVKCFFSDTILLSYTQGGKPAKPKAFTVDYTLAEWLGLLQANLASWAAATGKKFLVNGLSADSIAALTPTILMRENAFGSNTGVLPNEAAWNAEMQLLLQAQAAGHTPWVYVKMFDTAMTDAFRRLIVPSMYLLGTSSLLFELGPAEGGSPPWVTGEYKRPVYNPQIGNPVDEATVDAVTGVNRRDYDSGVVLVNPTAAGASVQVDPLASPVQVAPQSGVILKRAVTLTPVA